MHGLSRLYRRLVVEQRLATSVSSHNDSRVEAGIFWLFVEAAQDVDPRRLERAVDEEIGRLVAKEAGAAELRRAKRLIAAGEAHESETVSDIAEDLGAFAVDARWQLALAALDRIAAVSARSVRECAAKLLLPRRRVVGWCLPRSSAGPGPRRKP